MTKEEKEKINRYLTEAQGRCYHMPGIGHCHICDDTTGKRDDFFEWDVGFDNIWGWSKLQPWWEDFKKEQDEAIFWDPELFAVAVYNLLKEEENDS